MRTYSRVFKIGNTIYYFAGAIVVIALVVAAIFGAFNGLLSPTVGQFASYPLCKTNQLIDNNTQYICSIGQRTNDFIVKSINTNNTATVLITQLGGVYQPSQPLYEKVIKFPSTASLCYEGTFGSGQTFDLDAVVINQQTNQVIFNTVQNFTEKCYAIS